MILDRNQIMEIIPHRDPFLFVDQITSITPGHSAVGEKYVHPEEAFFEGHFPQEKVMPGVLMIEAIAQVGAVTLLAKEEFRGRLVYFAGMKSAKFRRKVLPGDTLRMEVEISKFKARFGVGKGVAYVGEDVACEAEFSFVLAE
ncbi:MAG: 3-hydroxyacyl-ACP dehydratase FabZ [Candidatus Izemoplasmatales bacterium]|nr:3-hydroxyacyl-ACP dehydratase FabZ [Candidatus Izemoplasmatales bacterium]